MYCGIQIKINLHKLTQSYDDQSFQRKKIIQPADIGQKDIIVQRFYHNEIKVDTEAKLDAKRC